MAEPLLQEPELKGRQARLVRKALDEVRNVNADGLLVAEEVVEAARDPKNPLHRHFNWEDTSAAHQWRLAQARALIRQITVTMPDDPTETAVPKFVSLLSDRKRTNGGYRETSKVLSSKQLRDELEATAKRELQAWSERYQMLVGLVSRVRAAAGLPRPGAKKRRKKGAKTA